MKLSKNREIQWGHQLLIVNSRSYPLIKQALETKGIPCLYMEIGQKAETQAQTRIQAFAEIS